MARLSASSAAIAPIVLRARQHDYYRSSIASVRGAMQRLPTEMTWLPGCGPLQITAAHDDPRRRRLGRRAVRRPRRPRCSSPTGSRSTTSSAATATSDVAAARRERGAHAARVARAAPDSEHLLVLTHVPPFPEACIYDDVQSEPAWLPWFTCIATGELLARVRARASRPEITVLCGHSHGIGIVSAAAEPEVRTGGWPTGVEGYGNPVVQATLELCRSSARTCAQRPASRVRHSRARVIESAAVSSPLDVLHRPRLEPSIARPSSRRTPWCGTRTRARAARPRASASSRGRSAAARRASDRRRPDPDRRSTRDRRGAAGSAPVAWQLSSDAMNRRRTARSAAAATLGVVAALASSSRDHALDGGLGAALGDQRLLELGLAVARLRASSSAARSLVLAMPVSRRCAGGGVLATAADQCEGDQKRSHRPVRYTVQLAENRRSRHESPRGDVRPRHR